MPPELPPLGVDLDVELLLGAQDFRGLGGGEVDGGGAVDFERLGQKRLRQKKDGEEGEGQFHVTIR